VLDITTLLWRRIKNTYLKFVFGYRTLGINKKGIIPPSNSMLRSWENTIAALLIHLYSYPENFPPRGEAVLYNLY
jgi:hypothetical protein